MAEEIFKIKVQSKIYQSLRAPSAHYSTLRMPPINHIFCTNYSKTKSLLKSSLTEA